MRTLAKSILALALALGGACKESSDTGPTGDGEKPAAARSDEPAAGDEKESGLPAAEAVLERAVEAAGGRAVLDGVESFHLTGAIAIPGQNIEGNIEIWWKGGDFYTEQHMHGIGKLRAGKSGETIWSDDPINGLRELEGTEAEQHTWASSLLPAADWKRYFEKAETLAERDLDGTKVYDIELTSESGASVVMTFDAESGLQVEQKYEQVTPMGKMPVSVKLEDYRDVDGIKVAFKQVTDAALAKATQTITKVVINAEVDTSNFAKPAGGHDTVRKDTLMPFDVDGKPGKPVPTKP